MAIKKVGSDNKNKVNICFNKESVICSLEEEIYMKINSYILKHGCILPSGCCYGNMSKTATSKEKISVEIEFSEDIFDVNAVRKLAKKCSNEGWNTHVDEVYRELTLN